MKTLFASILYKIHSIPKIFTRMPLTENHLGRWKIDECNKKINIKVDMSNEDHCGPCGYYAMTKIKSKEKSPTIGMVAKNLPSK
jgi:hypothetical protein